MANPPFEFSSKFSSFENQSPDKPAHTHQLPNEDFNYSPRSSVVYVPEDGSASVSSSAPEAPGLDNYRGFHANKGPRLGSVPPLSHPIKPKFRRKGGSLLGKLIYSNRKDSESSTESADEPNHRDSVFSHGPTTSVSSPHSEIRRSVASAASNNANKFKFRLSSLTFDHPHPVKSRQNSSDDTRSSGEANVNVGSPLRNMPTSFDLDIDKDDLQSIVKTSDHFSPQKQSVSSSTPSTGSKTEANTGAWKPPDSWDVKFEDHVPPEEIEEVSSDEEEKKKNTTDEEPSVVPEEKEEPSLTVRPGLPLLYGAKNSGLMTHPSDPKSSNHIIRVFREDNTFTTILNPLETTTAELLGSVQKKFFLESTANLQIAVYIGNYVKILESAEKPLKIQNGLLSLSGFKEADNLRIMGREDLSFLCKFVVENVYLRNLTHEEEVLLSRDYVNVDISSLNLKNVPIIFHQHTYEIESLNVADNPAIYIPLDFIQSCTYLTTLTFSKNGCSKFPSNFLEAKSLVTLDMEKNFLDEIPPKISHLKNLKHLKLNSNQLNFLPKSFSKLQNLETLNLSSNYFGSYPDAVSELVNLKDLDLSYNDLSSVPQSISKLIKLNKLNLCTNKLSKALPEFFAGLVSLKRLDIRYNKISNIDVLGNLSSLEAVYASKNNISGFSDRLESLRLLHLDRNPITNLEFKSKLIRLSVIDLSKAKLTIVPGDFFDQIVNVEKLVLDKNHLVTLPEEIGNLSRLTYLSIFGNNLQELPDNIGKLSLLQYFDLHSNNLQSLPPSIWHLKALTFLNISSNMLNSFPKPPTSPSQRVTSTVNFKSLLANRSNSSPSPYTSKSPTPVDLGDLQKSPSTSDMKTIREINEESSLDADSLSSIGMDKKSSLADSLMVLTLADNSLNDECFNSLSLLTQLKTLNLSYNDILEIPPGALRSMSRLDELYLSGNELATLPADDFESIKNLKLLFLNNNKLVTLPAELSKLKNLQHLDVGSNQLKYNISNWPYDWSWHWNQGLKYLNFSGNKRFEIKQSHVKNPETNEVFDSLLVLKNLKVLGLIDVTLTTTSIPDQTTEMRIRTTASELDNIGYGVADCMGTRDYVSMRDIFIQKFRGNENEILFATFDGKFGNGTQGHRISAICKTILPIHLAYELDKAKSESDIPDALRKAFLSLNKDINGTLASKRDNTYTVNSKMIEEFAKLNPQDDGSSGCSITLIYMKDKKLYTANIGDTEALLTRSNGSHSVLTTRHDPTNREEFERIRAAGGYVSGDGSLDGDLWVSRGAGFFKYIPHIHSGPDVTSLEITKADETIILATRILWNYVTYELAVDVIRSVKDDPMLAAQKLRDYAISYGASDKIAVMVVTLGDHQSDKLKFGNNSLFNNLGRDTNFITNKKRRDRSQGDTGLRRLEDEIEPPVGELALVFTDIKNSTLLWDGHPTAMRSAIKIHNSIMRRQLRIVGGYEVKTEGDAFMVSFPTPTSALLWCFNVQQQLLTADWPVEILDTDQCFEVTDNQGNIIYRGLSVRMGLHWGSPVCELDVITRRMDYFGPIVNRTSRVSALADGGQICISSNFYDEIKGLFRLHEEITSGKLSLEEAYQGNIEAGEIIEREITALDEIGCVYYELGEKKLKGLEAPEQITLVYPRKLAIRFEIFQKDMANSEEKNRVFGAIPVDSIYGLRTVSLKLEAILGVLNGGVLYSRGNFEYGSSDTLLKKSSNLFKESELLELLEHVVTRVENCVTVLHLRQQLSIVDHGSNGMSFQANKTMKQLMDDLTSVIQDYQKITNA